MLKREYEGIGNERQSTKHLTWHMTNLYSLLVRFIIPTFSKCNLVQTNNNQLVYIPNTALHLLGDVIVVSEATPSAHTKVSSGIVSAFQ